MSSHDISALFGKAVDHHLKGRLADALVSYDAVLQLDPRMSAAHCNRGLVLQSLRRYEEALRSYDQAVRLQPSYADAYFNRAITLRLLNRPEDAIRNYDKVVTLKPDHVQAYGNRGNVLLALGRPKDAIASYDQAIALNSRFAEAYFNRGNAFRSLGQLDEAVRDFARAAELNAGFAEAFNNKGCALRDLGRPLDALRDCDRAIALKPDFAEAHFNRANAQQDLERSDEALRSFDRALQINPDYSEAWNNRGYVLKELARTEEAIASFDKAIALRPNFAEAYSNRGNALRDLGRCEESLESCDRAIELKPDLSEAYYNKGNALQDLGRDMEALACYERALVLKPDFFPAYNGKGNALKNLFRLEEALASYREAIGRKPDFADAHNNSGNVLKELGRIEDALRSYDRAMELKKDFVEAHWNKGICSLTAGDFATGWPLYEWRKRKAEPFGVSPHSQPVWSGAEPLAGKTLFVHAEQGLGDTIQFCRFAILAQKRGAKVILAVQEPLVRLLQNLGPNISTIALSSPPPDFDFQVALMSLPLAFETGGTCPVQIPYLHAEGDRIENWRRRIGDTGVKIGICWQGNRKVKIDAGRSFPLRHFEAISVISDIRLISLQKNDGLEQLAELPAGLQVETLGKDFDAGPGAFLDTAAVMMLLDLVITSDTAIAHLAGALGRPVWLLLQHAAEWRWMLERADSPWYPTVRLFRQKRHGDWAGVFTDVQRELRKRIQPPRDPDFSHAAT
ncbi:MAG TPA: tetratricopeptide repeat protein [Rhizomicrobium sp.]|jgi:tetratricopeptide (TPR) repeat protein